MFKVMPLLSALGISTLMAFLSVETGCMSVPRNKVIEESPRLTLEKRLFPNFFEFGDAFSHYFEKRLKIIQNEKVIAWAVKGNVLQFPTGLKQEAIVMVNWIDETNGAHVSLAYCTSWGGGGWDQRTWNVYGFIAGKRLEDWDSTPSSSQIADFIRATNFGYNEYLPREALETWRVESYTNEPTILNALHGISDKERSRRFSNTMEWLPN
jgi:hypothetical protein